MNILPTTYSGGDNGVYYLVEGAYWAVEAKGQIEIARDGALRSISFNVQANTKDGNTILTVRLNGGATTLTRTIAAGWTGTFTVVGNITGVAGNLVALQMNTSASSSGAIQLAGNVEYVPS